MINTYLEERKKGIQAANSTSYGVFVNFCSVLIFMWYLQYVVINVSYKPLTSKMKPNTH